MDDVSSLACPTMAGTVSVPMARDASRSFFRWAVVGAASAILFVLALMQSGSVGAAAPPCIPISYGNCVVPGTAYLTPNVGVTYAPAPATTNSTYPPNTVIVPPYFDNRYGYVEVVTDGSGNLIDVNPFTGQRIYPIFPDFGNGFIGNGFIGANFNNGVFLPPGTTNGITCNGVYGCPFGGGFIGNGAFNNVNGNNCAFANCAGAFPANATVAGGVVFYNDNRFCTDGKVAYVPGRGYFCQNGGPLVTNNNATTVNCGNFFFDGCGIYRPFAANTTAPVAPQQTTTAPAPAAPQAAAPVVVQQVPAAAAPSAPTVTALTAPQSQAPAAPAAGSVHVQSAPAAAAPVEKETPAERHG